MYVQVKWIKLLEKIYFNFHEVNKKNIYWMVMLQNFPDFLLNTNALNTLLW